MEEIKRRINNEKLEIFYDYSKPYKKGYYYIADGKTRSLKENRKSNSEWVRMDEIISLMSLSKRNMNKIKFCDPNLIEILFNEKGLNCVDEYLDQLENGKRANKKSLQYNMNYNLSSILMNTKGTFRSKLNIINMVRKNRHIANVDYKFKAGKAVASIIAAIGLALGIGPKLLPGNANQNDKDFKSSNKNAIVESFDNNDVSKYDIEYDVKDNKMEEEKQNTRNEQYVKAFDNFSQQSKEEINARTQEIINNYNEKLSQKQNNKQEINKLQLGSVLELPEGTQFMEGVSGGRVGKIGDSLSPGDGIYVAEISDTSVSSRYGLDGKIEKNENAKQYVHISYVAGATTIEEAHDIIEKQKQNIKDGEVADRNVVRPRGWVSQETIQKIYEQQNNKEIDEIER